ncbi:hypothetical protein MLD38_005928 [Melastoma candidum]|uniref:Uncharacterized protein n=1 Tax=Melastoma candidum TaxID=119954 RepID=A0ACB9RUP5_9MYRT|nr:hypothetical protein MLD38_005928 [Melastoma candidum]
MPISLAEHYSPLSERSRDAIPELRWTRRRSTDISVMPSHRELGDDGTEPEAMGLIKTMLEWIAGVIAKDLFFEFDGN